MQAQHVGVDAVGTCRHSGWEWQGSCVPLAVCL